MFDSVIFSMVLDLAERFFRTEYNVVIVLSFFFDLLKLLSTMIIFVLSKL